MNARRAYFLFWLIAGAPALFMFFLLVPLCVVNLIAPERRKWKTVLLIAFYGPFLPLSLVNLVSYGNLYYVVFAVLFFVLAVIPKTRRVAFFGTLALALWLYLASLAQAYLGLAGVVAVTLGIVAGTFVAARKQLDREWFHFPADAFAHYFLVSLVLLSWFFFLPSPVASRFVTAQAGVQAVAVHDSDSAYRGRFAFHQMNFVDELSPGVLLVGVKRKLPNGMTIHRNYVFDVAANKWRDSPLPQPVTSVHLIRCEPGDYLLPESEKRNWVERTVNMGRGFSWYGPTMAGFCLPTAGVYLVGDETSAKLVDRADGEVVHEFAFTEVLPLAPLRFFAPYGDGKIASFHNRYFTRITYDRAGREVHQDRTVYREDLFGESIVLGAEGHPYIYLVKTNGKVRKIDPEGPYVKAENRVLPGFRFATFDPHLRLLYVVNELLGIVEVVDAETMRRIDWVYIGHAGRRVNLAVREPGVGYVVSAVGILKLDFCRRLPERCGD